MHQPTELKRFLRALPLIIIGGFFLSGFSIFIDSPHDTDDISAHYEFQAEEFNKTFFKGSNHCTCSSVIRICPEESEIYFYAFDSRNQSQAFIISAKNEIPYREKKSNNKIYYPSLSWEILNGRLDSQRPSGKSCMTGGSVVGL